MIHALYVDPFGPYPKLLGAAQCWDQKRDALAYMGPHAVVAHPPCGPWGWLRRNFKGGEQAKLHGRFAADCVQRFGGVLEQPESSKLWDDRGLPYPDDGFPPDEFGGFSLEVLQVDWGHRCRKHTWLYVVCKGDAIKLRDELSVEADARRGTGTVTHWIGGSRKNPKGAIPPGIKAASAEMRRKTPVPFAQWLISIAERCT